MTNAIVIYYSKNGSNRFLAEQISAELQCDMVPLKPRLNSRLLMLMGVNFGNRRLKANPATYDLVILCGPIWMGKFVIPLKNFVKAYEQDIRKLFFVTCCGSGDAQKDEKFGHGHVFREVQGLLPEKCAHCAALPITLVIPEDQQDDPNAVMQTRLTSANFKGEIRERFTAFIETAKGHLQA
jgi:flavodoxin